MSDPVNYHPHSRYTLHEKAGLFPFRDLIWNKTDGPFIDLKVDFPDPANFYADGTAYLRVEDVIEMAHVLGMSTREEVDALRKENEELKAKLLQLPTKVESFKNDLSRTTTDFLSSLDATVTLALAHEKAAGDAEPYDPKKSASFNKTATFDLDDFDEGTGPSDRGSGDSDESAEQPSDESPVGKGPNELSGSDSDSADPLASFLGIVGKD
jgi:hypothetical protein